MVAVAEVASGHQGHSGSTSTARASRSLQPGGPLLGQLALGVALAWALSPAVWANPTGGVAVHGQATMTNTGTQLTVTTQNGTGTNHSAIDWKTFSIPTGSLTRIDQPNAASFSINRVVTNTPTEIYGTLSSNGRVVLVNQAGIAVSAGALVDTAGFTATALAMSDQDALAGRLRFGSSSGIPAVGALQVQGNIIARGGDVVLVAPSIELAQTAVVESMGGSVLLAAGQSVEVTGRGLEGISMQLQAPSNAALNLGTLKGDAVGIFAGSLKHSGLIQATAASMAGGKVVLQASDEALVEGNGKIIASSAVGQGGSVSLLGNHVGLLDNASIDASGASGGGTILVGGDYQGNNATVQNAEVTFVSVDSVLSANATGAGNGGKIIIWSDDTTRMYGGANAKGGALGGNGGFIEASGKKYLDFQGLTDTRAAKGSAGTLLLDPDTITIDNSVTDLAGGIFNVSTSTIFAGATGNPTLTWATINAQSGVVDIQSSPSASTGSGDINITASGAVTGPTTLSLLANRAINLSPGVVVNGGAANLHLLAGWTTGTSVAVGVGNDINLGAGSGISTSGNVWLNAGGIVNGNGGTISAGNLSVSNVGGGGVHLNAVNMVTGFAADVTFATGGLEFKNGMDFAVGPSSFVTGLIADDNVNPIFLTTTAGGITLNSNVRSASIGGAPITITSQGGIYLNAPITTTSNATPAGPVKLVAGVNGITGNPGSVITANGLEVLSAGPVDLTGASNDVVTLAAVVTGGGSFKYAGVGAIAVGTVGGTSGITTGNAEVEVTGGDAFNISKPVNAGTSRVTLKNTSTGSAVSNTQTGTGVITAGQLEVSVPSTTGPVDLLLANQIGTVAINAKGQITFKNANLSGLTVGTVGSTTGIVSVTEGIEIEQNCGCAITLTQPVTAPAGSLVKIKTGIGALLTTGSGKVHADKIDLQVNAGPTPGAVGGPGTPFITEDYGLGVVMNIGDTNGGVAGLYLSHTGSLNFGTGTLNVAPNAAVTISAAGSVNVTAVDTGTSDLWLESTGGAVGSPTSGSFKGHNISLLSHTGVDINGDVEAAGNLYFGVSAAGAVTQNADGFGIIKVAGTTTYAGLAGNDVNLKGTLSGPTNEFTGAVTIPAGSGVVTLKNEGNLVVGNMSGASILLSSANGSISQTAGSVITTASLGATAKSGIVLGQANAIAGVTATNAGSGAAGNIELNSTVNLTVNTSLSNSGASPDGKILLKTSGNLTLSGNVSSTNGTGDAVVLVAGGSFVESGLISVPGGARWLIYSANPLSNTIIPTGGVDTNSLFQQYGATYGVTTVLGGGNGLLYSMVPGTGAPTSLGGTVSKVYDGTTTASLTAANYSVSPVTAPVWSGPVTSTSIIVDVAGTGAYSDANVGAGKLVTSTGGTVHAIFPSSRVVYGIPMALASGSIGDITGLNLVLGTLTGSVTKVYDGSNAAVLQPSNYALTGFIGSDGATVGNVVGTFGTKNVGTGLTITALLQLSDFSPIGATNFANYTLPTSVTGNIGTITPKALGVTGLTASNKIYDAGTIASMAVGSLSGVVPNDVVTVDTLSGSFDNKNAGTNKQVNVNSLSLAGADAGNYSISTAGLSTTANIDPKVLDLSGLVAQSKVYDGNTTASVGGNGLANAVTGDDLALTINSSTFDNKNAGLAKPVTLSGIQLIGADAANYSLPSTTLVRSADILPRPVTIAGAQALTKEYNGKTDALINVGSATVSSAVPGDSLSIASMTGSYADKDVGVSKSVTFDTITFAGADAGNYKWINLGGITADITARKISNWIGAVGGLWSDPANWDVIPNGTNVLAVNVPAGLGAVTVDASAGAITLQSLSSSSGFVIAGGSLQISDSFTSNAYLQRGGSVSGNGAFKVNGSFDQSAGTLAFGSVDIVQTTGDLNVRSISAPSVILTATSGAIHQADGGIQSASLTTSSTAGTYLNAPGNQLQTFNGTNKGTGDIELVNSGVLKLKGVLAEGGSIKVVNTGGVSTTVLVSARDGSVSLTANSPLTIGEQGIQAGGNISLVATNLTSAGNITLDGPIESTSGSVALSAASNLTQNSSILAPLGVRAAAGGTMTFGPLATSGYQPLSYSANNQSVSPPRSPTSSGSASDLVVSLMQSAPSFIEVSRGPLLASLLNVDKERDLSKELIVSEGQICRP